MTCRFAIRVRSYGLASCLSLAACGDGEPAAASDAAVQNDAAQASDAGTGNQDAAFERPDAAAPGPGECAPARGVSLSELAEQGKAELIRQVAITRNTTVVDGDFYYVEDGMGLIRIKAGSTQAEVILPGTETAQPAWFKVAGASLYYVDKADSPLVRVPLDSPGATPEALTGTLRGTPRVIDGDTLYGYDATPAPATTQEVWKQDFKTGAVTVLATVQEDIGGIDLANGQVFYSDATFGVDTVFRVSASGGTPQPLDNGDHFNPGLVRVLGGALYWGDGYRLYVSDPTSNDPGTATKPFGEYGPQRSTFSQGGRELYRISEEGDRIYWQDDEGGLGWTTKDRATCGTVATIPFPDEVLALGGGFAFASTSNRVYRIALE